MGGGKGATEIYSKITSSNIIFAISADGAPPTSSISTFNIGMAISSSSRVVDCCCKLQYFHIIAIACYRFNATICARNIAKISACTMVKITRTICTHGTQHGQKATTLVHRQPQQALWPSFSRLLPRNAKRTESTPAPTTISWRPWWLWIFATHSPVTSRYLSSILTPLSSLFAVTSSVSSGAAINSPSSGTLPSQIPPLLQNHFYSQQKRRESIIRRPLSI